LPFGVTGLRDRATTFSVRFFFFFFFFFSPFLVVSHTDGRLAERGFSAGAGGRPPPLLFPFSFLSLARRSREEWSWSPLKEEFGLLFPLSPFLSHLSNSATGTDWEKRTLRCTAFSLLAVRESPRAFPFFFGAGTSIESSFFFPLPRREEGASAVCFGGCFFFFFFRYKTKRTLFLFSPPSPPPGSARADRPAPGSFFFPFFFSPHWSSIQRGMELRAFPPPPPPPPFFSSLSFFSPNGGWGREQPSLSCFFFFFFFSTGSWPVAPRTFLLSGSGHKNGFCSGTRFLSFFFFPFFSFSPPPAARVNELQTDNTSLFRDKEFSPLFPFLFFLPLPLCCSETSTVIIPQNVAFYLFFFSPLPLFLSHQRKWPAGRRMISLHVPISFFFPFAPWGRLVQTRADPSLSFSFFFFSFFFFLSSLRRQMGGGRCYKGFSFFFFFSPPFFPAQ